MENTVKTIAINDCVVRPIPLDCQVAGKLDIQVAVGVIVFVCGTGEYDSVSVGRR